MGTIQFKVKLADVPVGISAQYDTTKQFCRDYLTEEEAKFQVTVCGRDIAYEREKSAREDTLQGKAVRRFSDSYLETLAVYRKIAAGLLDDGVLLFHGSAIAVDGVGYLFTAASGTGKSTHVRLWRELFGERAQMINDDKPLLRITDSGVVVYGAPWDGKHHLSNNTAAPLKAICLLERGRENQIRRIASGEAWPQLLQQSYRPQERQKLEQTMRLIGTLTQAVSFYRLGCNMQPEAAEVSYHGMQG